MAVITTGDMNLPIPTLTDQGPDYAQQVNNSLTIVSNHAHDGSANGGTILNLAVQDCLGNLSAGGFNLANVRSLELNNQSGNLTGTQDVNCLYVNQENLGFNNSSGVFVPITNGNSLAIVGVSFTNFTIRSVSSNFDVEYTDTYNMIDINSTGGAITGSLPIASTIVPTAAGRLYIFRDVGLAAATNNITISVNNGSGNVFADSNGTSITIASNGGYIGIYTDGVNKWYTFTQSNYNTDQTLQMNANSTLALNSATMTTSLSGINIGGLSQLTVLQSSFSVNTSTASIINSTLAVQGTTTTVDSASVTNWQTGCEENFQTGSALTIESNATLAVSGTLVGSTSALGTLTINNTLGLAGTTNVPGTMNITGSALIPTGGTLTADGGSITVNTSGTMLLDSTSSFTSHGKMQMAAVSNAYTYVAPNTIYFVDSTTYDYFVGIGVIAGPGTAYSVNTIYLPPNPTVGRTIIIGDVKGDAPNLSSAWIVAVYGNGNPIGIWYGGAAQPALGGSVQIAAINNSTAANGGYGTGKAFWSVTLQFIGAAWIPVTTSF